MTGRRDIQVRVGDVEVVPSDARLTSSIDDLSRAELTAVLSAENVPDWSLPLTVEVDGDLIHTGSVLSAIPGSDGIAVLTATGIETTEVLMPVISAHDFPAQDLVYAAARAAGFKRERMEIHGLEDLPIEPVEVMVPLRDVRVTTPVEVGGLTLLPPDAGGAVLKTFSTAPPATSDDWDAADAFALVLRNAQLLAEAEIEALEILDAAIAWLATRARYGYAKLPDGTSSHYDRDAARSLPRRAGAMAVRGLLTGRRWLRDPENIARRETLDFGHGDLQWPPLSDDLAPGDRLALLAARRAAGADDPVSKATAISEAWEFYCGSVSPSSVLDEQERRQLLSELPQWLNDRQRTRVAETLGMVNNFPLWQRVGEALARDGVPVSPTEWKILKRVRAVRNRAVHGSEALETDADDLDLALSVLARALTFRMARIASELSR